MNQALEGMRSGRRIPALLQWSMVAFSVAGALLLIVLTIRTIVHWDVPDTGVGTTGNFTKVVVEKGSAAERAGLRSGDVLDLPAMSVPDRATVTLRAFAGHPVTIVVKRGSRERSFTYVVPTLPRKLDTLVSVYASIAVGAFFLLLAGVVVARRPTLDAVALWTFSLIVAPVTAPAEFFTSVPALALIMFAETVVAFASSAGLVWLALRATPSGRLRSLIAYGNALLWTVISSYSVVANWNILLNGVEPPPAVQAFFASGLQIVIMVGSFVAIIVVGFIRSRGAARVRLQWYLAAALSATIAVAIILVTAAVPALGFSTGVQLAVSASFDGALLLLAVSIMRHDLFGVGFVISRAAMYAVLTGLLVGTFAGTNWLIGLALKSAGLALPIDVLLAAGAGWSLSLVQRRATRVVDRMLFRRRYEAARRLARVARALTHVTEDAAIAEALVAEPCDALELHAAALFIRADGGSFARVSAYGWPPESASTIDANDRFVLHLLGGDDAPVRVDDVPHARDLPHGAPRPRIAFPLWSRRELIGIVFYSAHRSGATLDPEEVASIERLSSAATAAFDRVAAAQLRRTQDELAALRIAYERLLATMAPNAGARS